MPAYVICHITLESLRIFFLRNLAKKLKKTRQMTAGFSPTLTVMSISVNFEPLLLVL